VDYSSQTDFYNPVIHGGKIVVVGAGGIGSPTLLGLARLGIPKLSVYDDDTVEERNVTNQSYTIGSIGRPKSEVIAEQASEVGCEDVTHFNRRLTANDALTGDIIISAVDSMASRKEIYEATKKSPYTKYLIDGRLGGQLISLYTIDIRNKEHTEDVMFEDSEMVSQACTARTIYDVSLGVSALIVRAVRRLMTGEKVEKLQTLNMESLRLDLYM
jgi:molybdopterin/thiamine biosynthesis adenylyltransferase